MSDNDQLGSAVLPESDMEHPWRDEELMRNLYVGLKKSANQIAELLDCSQSTVSTWLKKHDIEMRSPGDSIRLRRHGSENYVPLRMHDGGYMKWRLSHKGYDTPFCVHRLLAVSKFGFDAVCDMDVHHKNKIPWDNRPDNIGLMAHGDHSVHHSRALDGIDRLRAAELYEHGEASSYTLGEMFGVANTTILNIHAEFYGDDNDE